MNDGPWTGSIGRVLVRVVAGIVTGLAALVVLVILLLQIDRVTTGLLPAAGRFLPWENATIEAGRVSLSGLSRIEASDLRVTAGDGRPLFTVDSLDLSIRPIALLARRVEILSLRATGVRAVARQRADSAWDLLLPFRAVPDTAPSGESLTVRIRAAEIKDVTITGYYAGRPDSLLIDDLIVRLGAVRTGENPAFTLDTLNATVIAPGRTRPAFLSGRARLSEKQLTVTGFRLQSDSSDVMAQGNLVLPGRTAGGIRDVDFRLVARPLDFRDLAPLVPSLRLPASMRLEARVTGRSSLLRLDIDGRTSDGSVLALEGEVTPAIDGPVRYDLDGAVQNLDPAMLGIANARGRTSAKLELRLAGDSLEAVSGTAALQLGSGLHLGDLEVSPTRVTARVERGVARYRMEGALLPWVGLSGDGTLTLFQDPPSYSLNLTVTQLRAVPDSGRLQVREVSALVRARGSGFTAARREGRATIRLGGKVGEAAITRGHGEARWQDQRVTAGVSGRLVGPRPVADSVATSVDWRDGVAHVRLAFAGLNLSVGVPALPTSRLNGSGNFEVHPGPADRMTARGSVDLAGSTLGRDSLGPGRLDLALQRGLFTIEGTLRALDGTVQLAATARPFIAGRPFDLTRVRFDQVQVASLTGGRVHHPLSGVLAARGTLPVDSLPQLTGRIDLDGGPFNRGRLDTLHAEFGLQGRQLRVEARAGTAEGEIELAGQSELLPNGSNGDNGSGSWTLGPTTLDGRFDLPDLAALMGDSGAGRATGRVHLTGQGTEPETMHWEADAVVAGRWDQARLDSLRLEGRVAEGRLTLDTLLVASNLLRGGGRGSTALTEGEVGPRDTVMIQLVADTTAPATLSGLFDIDPLSARVGSIRVLAWHAERKLQLRGTVHLGGLIAGAGGADTLAIDAGAALSRAGITDLRGTLTGLRVAWNRVELERLEATLESDSNRFSFQGKALRDDQHEFDVAAHGVAGERMLYFTGFGFGFGEVRWALADTARISFGDRLVVTDFDLRDGPRRIAIEGHLDRQATQDLTIRLDSVPLQQFAEFAGIEGMDAVLTGTIRVDGPAARPGLHTALTLTVQSVTARLGTRPAGEHLRLDVEVAAGQGENLTVQGTVPNRLSLLRDPPPPARGSEAVSLVIRSGGFPLDWMTPFLQGFGVDRLAGRLEADARIEGTVANPQASGTAALADGRIRMPRQGIDYTGISGRLSLTGDRLQVTSWTARADGSVGVEGHLVLTPLDDPRLDLRARFDGFRAIRSELVRLGLTGEASITGSLATPRLSGRLTLEKTDIFADRVGQSPAVRPVKLTQHDYQMLQSYFGYRPGSVREKGDLLEPWAIDLDVRLGGDVWLRKEVRPEVRVLLTGSLDVQKEPGDSLQLFGTVEAVPARSIVEQFGKRFAIEQGVITFNGPLTGWRTDLDARYEVPAYKDPGVSEVAITLSVNGTADNLRLTLGSEPSMETTDIISYLATGRPSRSAADFSAQSSAFALGALTDVLEDEAGQQIGLDVMEIRQDPSEGTIVIAGRYVSPKLYVGFQQPVTQGDREEGLDDQHQGTQVELEYTLYRWLLLNLQGGSEFRWFFRTRYAF